MFAFGDVFVSVGSAECVVEEVYDSVCAFHGFMVLGMHACDFVYGTESSVHCLTALGSDKFCARCGLFVDAFVDDRVFSGETEEFLCGCGGEIIS